VPVTVQSGSAPISIRSGLSTANDTVTPVQAVLLNGKTAR
jgi:hypothetical protein